MSDLTDDELRARLSWAMGERHLEPFVEPLRELQRHRAAQAASAERVREMVREAIATEMREYRLADDGMEPPMTLLDDERAALFTTIADRVAAQLTAPAEGGPG